MTGSQSVVPEEPYHRAAQHGREWAIGIAYRLRARVGTYSKGYGKNFRIVLAVEL